MKKVTLFISEGSQSSDKVKAFLDKNDVTYELKNVTKNKAYLKELQEMKVFGTPTLFIDGKKIEGNQENKILYELGLASNSSDDMFSFENVFRY
ncbi:glutaredoxin domain-containing protein [Oceanobacillus sp. CFH 90083]|uniref:glutaredoxin family protein n=1 Tax=Oceanobacillus sp. CFH 90083 TaxID=2592336 RepID=UPI00128CC767|nr:glutaredoxin domain-containing protein [Oceanobacillus sp. CFH 90083]